ILSTSARNLAARAAKRRGWDVTIAHSVATFGLELQQHDWDKIIIDAPTGILGSSSLSRIVELVGDGARLHLSYWSLSGANAAALRAETKVADVTPIIEPQTISEWTSLPPGTYPYPVWFPLDPEFDPWVFSGNALEVDQGGLALLGFTPVPTIGQAATIIANDGFTFVNGFDYDSHDPIRLMRVLLNQFDALEDATRKSIVRGDCNRDGARDIADPLFLLAYLNGGWGIPGCKDQCDANDDGRLDIADAIAQLNSLFAPDATPLPAPGPSCGEDPTMDFLTCYSPSCI
ncbi:MAG: hypothetical protein KDC38_19180, partial [Planctomycetes bacterium]|nr:hypothetical protein [Planctomycetota bacterium]